jgi:hypothetical protein
VLQHDMPCWIVTDIGIPPALSNWKPSGRSTDLKPDPSSCTSSPNRATIHFAHALFGRHFVQGSLSV